MSYDEKIAGNARLRILQELQGQTDGRLNVLLLRNLLDARYGINRDREWVETQLRCLKNVGGVELVDGAVLIASITRSGRNHLNQRSALVGVTRPSEVE